MDRDHELDQILERTAAALLKSLDAVVDVDRRLRDLHREMDGRRDGAAGGPGADD